MPHVIVYHKHDVINTLFMEEAEIEDMTDNMGRYFPDHCEDELCVHIKRQIFTMTVEESEILLK